MAPECAMYNATGEGACTQLVRARTAGRRAASSLASRTEEPLGRINKAWGGAGIREQPYSLQRRGGGRRRPWRSHLALSSQRRDISFLRFHTADEWAVPYLDGCGRTSA